MGRFSTHPLPQKTDGAVVLRTQLRTVVADARASGMSVRECMELVGEAFTPWIEEEVGVTATAFALPGTGLRELLEIEAPLLSVKEAAASLRQPRPLSNQTVRNAIRAGRLVAYRASQGTYWLPRWQFRPEGGIWPGLREVVGELKRDTVAYCSITPFLFFLQYNPLTKGQMPIDALRAGRVDEVLVAARAHGF